MSFPKAKGDQFFYHEIAIAFKASEFTLLAKELIDLDDVADLYKKEIGYRKHNQAMLVLLGHNKSKETIVIGNCHLYYAPKMDHIKFAQANFILDKAAAFCRRHNMEAKPIPFVCCGDFNSLPQSAAVSAFYGEDLYDVDKTVW